MFEFQKQCVLEHVQGRKGTNDESVVAIDIKLSVEDLPAKAAAAVLRADKDEDMDLLFSEDGERRFIGMTEIPIEESWEGHHQVKISTFPKLRVAKLHKLVLMPRSKGLFDAVFTVTIEEPPEGMVDALFKKLHSSCAVKIEQDAELPLKKAKDDDKKAGAVKKKQGADLLDQQSASLN